MSEAKQKPPTRLRAPGPCAARFTWDTNRRFQCFFFGHGSGYSRSIMAQGCSPEAANRAASSHHHRTGARWAAGSSRQGAGTHLAMPLMKGSTPMKPVCGAFSRARCKQVLTATKADFQPKVRNARPRQTGQTQDPFRRRRGQCRAFSRRQHVLHGRVLLRGSQGLSLAATEKGFGRTGRIFGRLHFTAATAMPAPFVRSWHFTACFSCLDEIGLSPRKRSRRGHALAAEMSIGGRLRVDRLVEIKMTANAGWRKVDQLADDVFHQLLPRPCRSR